MDPARVLVEFGDPAAWPNGARGASTGGGYALFAWGVVDLFAGDAIPSASGWHIGSLRFGSTGPGW